MRAIKLVLAFKQNVLIILEIIKCHLFMQITIIKCESNHPLFCMFGQIFTWKRLRRPLNLYSEKNRRWSDVGKKEKL